MKRPGSIFCVVTVLLYSALASSVSAAPAFSVHRNTVLEPRQVWPGDFNGDGIPDLAGSTRPEADGPPIVSVLLGRGDGTFGPPILSGVMGEVYAVGDVDNDSRLDLLVQRFPQPDEDVLILAGRGDGTFPRVRSVTTVYLSNFGLLTDLDGDGNRDVVVSELGEGGSDSVTIYRGRGDLTFDSPGVVLPAGFVPVSGVASDLNGDGRRDLVVANLDDSFISVYRNNGALNFTAESVPSGFAQTAGVTVGDVNGDGIHDLVYTQTSGDGYPYGEGDVFIARGVGDGTFGSPTRYQVARGAWKVVLADVTRDGIVDIVTANRSSIYIDDCGGDTRKTWDSLSVLAGVGDGTFRAAEHFSIGNQLYPDADRDRNAVASLVVADLNGDGTTDLITSGGTVFLNQPSDPNRDPTVSLGPDQTYSGSSFGFILNAMASDVDQDMLTYAWSADAPGLLPPIPNPCLGSIGYGTFHFTVTVDDGHGHQASDTIALTFVDPSASEPRLTIQAPAANEVIPAGQPYTLRWHIDNPTGSIEQTSVLYSPDDGVTWEYAGECHHLPVPQTSANQDVTCTWNNPAAATARGRIAVNATDADGVYVTGASAGPIVVQDAPGALPSPWRHQDVGAVGTPGSASYSNAIFTVSGSGADIWNGADEFHYVYQTIGSDHADVEIVTRVDSVQNVNAWTKAGLMFRRSLDPAAAHASIFVSPGKGIAFQRRTAAGATSVHTAGPILTAPVWLRLTSHVTVTCPSCARVVIVRAYYRRKTPDPWTLVGSQEFRDAGTQFGYVGLALSSHVDGTVATAAFSGVVRRDLPSWSTTTVGAATGSTSDVEDPLTLKASGADIWGAADAFEYLYNQAGNTITARVRSVTNTNAWTKAGVMFRDDLGADSAHVMVVVTPGKGIAMQYRATRGGESAQVAQVSGAAPAWVRLTRTNLTTYTGSFSTDGVTWNTLGSVMISMINPPLVGLALTSHTTDGSSASAVFDEVTQQP